VDYLVQRLKFSDELATAALLAQCFVSQLDKSADLPGLLVPVPLHASRLRTRGYNQSTELARHIGRSLELPVSYRACKRHRKTETQSLLPAGKRKSNLRGAFIANKKLETDYVAIVDDVMTSGHTANELAKVLKDAGVQRVDVWVIARAGIK
jgi:ComF family protein